MSESVHVHIGAGALGLGLVGWAAQQAGTRFVVASRTADKESAERLGRIGRTSGYDILVRRSGHGMSGPERLVRPERVAVADVISTNAEMERLFEVVAQPSTEILTTAVTLRGLEALAPALRAMLERRQRARTGVPLYVIACENRTGPEFARVVADLSSEEIRFRRTVVDRICIKLDPDPDGALVLTEPFWQWLLEAADEDRGSVLADRYAGLTLGENITASSASGVFFVDDIEAYKLRKLWMVNAPHTALALFSHHFGVWALHVWLGSEEGKRIAEMTIRELRTGLLAIEPQRFDIDRLAAFSEVVLARFSTFPDRLSRILRNLDPHTLAGFCGDLHDKLAAPAYSYSIATGEQPVWLNYATYRGLQAVREGRFVSQAARD